MTIRRSAAAAVVALAWFVVAAALPTPAAGHEIVLLFGHTAAGQLRIDADLHHPIGLPESIFPGIPGYALGEPAFHSTVFDDSTAGLFQPAAASNFQFVVTAADPGIGIYTPSGLLPLNTPVALGQPVVDYHPIWQIPAGPIGATYNITVKLQDTTGTYADSGPLTIPFTTVPEPHGIALLALGVVGLRRRRIPR